MEATTLHAPLPSLPHTSSAHAQTGGVCPPFTHSHLLPSTCAARTPELEASFKTREMQFMVFDDSAGDDPARGIIGVAFVPLAELAKGLPVEGAFRLINPVTRQEAGQLVLGMGWHNPLRLPGEAPPNGGCG